VRALSGGEPVVIALPPPTESLPATAPRRGLARRRAPVALLAGVLAAAAFASNPGGGRAAIAAFMALVLVVLAASDLERRVIPNWIVLPAAAIVLAARVVLYPGHALEFALAAIGAAAFLLVPNLINSAGMGMGDVKLALLMGAGMGTAVIGALLVAFVSSMPFALWKLIRGGAAARKATIPFGPFLAFGALLILIVPRLAGLGGS
jgi:leader peptidase (prepilin peptidase)/N-methyltransferase